jgi:hypothetical protein
MKSGQRKSRDPALQESAARVADALGRESCVLIGGLAVAAYGHERATKDVDFIARMPLRDAKKKLVAHGISVEVRRGDPFEGVPTSLKARVNDVVVDVLPMLTRIDWDRLKEVPLSSGTAVKVIDLDTLLLLKLRAGGVQDVLDVAQLVWRNPDRLPLARDLAGRHGVAGRLESYLLDRRERRKFIDGLPREKRRRAREELQRLLPMPAEVETGRRR